MATGSLDIHLKHTPELDSGFVPAAVWVRQYRQLVERDAEAERFAFALSKPDVTVSVFKTKILSHVGDKRALNLKYVERLLKFLLSRDPYSIDRQC